MYLSQFRLNPTRVQTRRAVMSPQVMHAMVLGSFSPGSGEQRPLWRLDQESSHELVLYIVSDARPDLTGLAEQMGWAEETTHRCAPYERLLDRLAEGQQWAFRLTVNPTTSVAGAHGARGKVRPLRTVKQQEDWFLARCGRWGFTVPVATSGVSDMAVVRRGTDAFTRADGDSKGRVELTRATFAGRLEVSDPEALRMSLTRGIGRGKAYGCGLLTLAPL